MTVLAYEYDEHSTLGASVRRLLEQLLDVLLSLLLRKVAHQRAALARSRLAAKLLTAVLDLSRHRSWGRVYRAWLARVPTSPGS